MREVKDLRGAIFDLDGTLIDSLGVWSRIDVEFLARRGIDVPDDYSRAIQLMTASDIARYTIERFSLPDTVEGLIGEWLEMARHEYAHNVPLKAGALAYLKALRGAGVKLAVATSLQDELATSVLANNGAIDLLDAICHTEDVCRDKSSPDLFLYTAGMIATPPRRCAVFEDILPAIRSAKEAGMFAICISDEASSHDEDDLRRESDLYLDDFTSAPMP